MSKETTTTEVAEMARVDSTSKGFERYREDHKDRDHDESCLSQERAAWTAGFDMSGGQTAPR